MLGLSSWAPAVSAVAALSALLLADVAYHRGNRDTRMNVAIGVLSAVAALGLTAAALGW
ncbi:hypothetical protein ACWENQ_44930 [Nonomuraea sp. NPDC004354]